MTKYQTLKNLIKVSQFFVFLFHRKMFFGLNCHMYSQTFRTRTTPKKSPSPTSHLKNEKGEAQRMNNLSMASQLLTKYRTLPFLELQNIESTSTSNGR